MEDLTFSHIAWDTWKATRGGMKAIEARQQRRLIELVEFVRTHSDFYADKYSHLPGRITDVRQLPPVMKPELLKYFNTWMTDHEITRASVDSFVADKSLVGHHYLGRYFVCTTSGTNGVINSNYESLSVHPDRARKHLVLFSPLVVILLGQLAARTIGPAMGVWSWIPLNIGYWITMALLIRWGGGRPAILRWSRPSRENWIWPSLAVIIAVAPTLPMLFPHTWLLFLQLKILLPTLLFVLINPFAEEGYWRGLLLDAVGNKNKWLGVLYSSTLFMVNHLWISVMVIGARNPIASVFQFVFGVLMSITYLKTQSLRWPLIAHFLTNLLTPTVAVFLNLYVPGISK